MKYAVVEKKKKLKCTSIIIFIISDYKFLNIGAVKALKTKHPKRLISVSAL